MTSTYFTVPSFARGKKEQEEVEKSGPEVPVLKEEDEKFLEEHIAQDAAPLNQEDVPVSKITDDGVEKEATKEEQEQIGATDQAIIPETQPSTDNTRQPPAEGEEMEKSYDDIMKEKAAERVKARKEKKNNKAMLELPSQEEAEAATRGFHTDRSIEEQAAERPERANKRSWTAFLSSIGLSSRQSPENLEQAESTEKYATGQSINESTNKETQSWKSYATSHLPSSWRKPTPTSENAHRNETEKTEEEDQPPPLPPRPHTLPSATHSEQQQQDREITTLLDQLSLSTTSNRMLLPISAETQKIYSRFALILKDTINGAPTAYEDMETLMREAGPKLEKQFKSLPPVVKTLVKSLPGKFIGPEILAAGAEKPADGVDLDLGGRPGTADSGVGMGIGGDGKGKEEDGKKKKKRRTIPGLKSLLSKEGAVASMLRNVVSFLQTRFPFLASTTSVVMGLAVFILMFVFWYCHKRGKEVRLAKEAEDAEQVEVAEDDDDDDTVDEEEDNLDELKGNGKSEDMQNYQRMREDVERNATFLSQPNADAFKVHDDKKKDESLEQLSLFDNE